MNPQLIWLLVTAIPDVIKLLEAIQKGITEQDTNRKVTDDLKTLHEAFAAKDAAKVTALFSGPAAPPDPAPSV